MPENRGPSNQPGHYDKARVARLRPIEEAVKKLALPLVRFRKIAGLLSAIEIQIENGGDSPEVNGLLLAALRAAVRHQVDDRQAQPTLRAIDGFEKAEAERWAQVRAGTLPPMARSAEEQLNVLMQEGYKLLRARQTEAACDSWLEAWELVKQLARPEMRTTEEFDKACRDLSQFVFNWCQDFEMELGNAAVDNPVYNEHRLRYARELLAQFPDEEPGFYVNFMRAQGEALWNLGRRAEAEALFSALVERVPSDAWAYIGWADQYWLYNHSPQEYAKAEAILKRGLAQPSVNDRAGLLERLEDLYGRWGKPVEQAAIATEQEQPKVKAKASQRSLLGSIGSLWQPANAPPPVSAPVKNPPTAAAKGPARAAVKKAAPAVPPAKKPGRNEPCWCGSGKKYKRCHLEADAAIGR